MYMLALGTIPGRLTYKAEYAVMMPAHVDVHLPMRRPAFAKVGWLLLIGTLVMAIAIQSHARDAASPALETVPAVRQVVPLERLYDGTVEAVNQATVSAQTSGRVAEILYDVNDYVEAGATIIRFTDVEQRAALRQAEAALIEANARRREAEENFRRTSQLYAARTLSKRDYDQALAQRDAAVARVKSAESAVEAARQQLEYTLVRAPYAGIVTKRHVELGESVAVGQPLMSGLSLEQLRVVVDLPQSVMARVRANAQATVVTDGGQRVPARRVTFFPFADPKANTFRVRIELPAGQFGLYPGMFVKAAFVVGKSERLLIPRDALLRRSEVTGVYVVNDVGRVRLRQVRIGNTFGDRVEVLAGLIEGERVAMDPVQAGIEVKSVVTQSHAR